MGNFYTNYTLKGVSQAAVAAAMSGRPAVVTPQSGDSLVVFDKASDKQSERIISELATKLSADLHCPVLAVLNHDDDILWYKLYVSGKPVDSYNSCPDYFDFDGKGEPRGPTGGNAAMLCQTFGCGDAANVENILRSSNGEGYPFAFQRHAALFEALGLPTFAVGNAYASFGRTGVPDGMLPKDVIRTA